MNKKITFIFDLDGTLLDSTDQIARCINRAREENGYPGLNERSIIELIGLPADALVRDLSINHAQEQKIIEEFRWYLKQEISSQNKLFPCVEDFLMRCESFNIKMGIASSKPHHLVEQIIKKTNLSFYIEHFQGIDNFLGKPNPTVILKVMERIESDKYLMFGDRIEDVMAAKAAGIDCIGISQTFHTSIQLINAGAIKSFSNFCEANLEFSNIIQ